MPELDNITVSVGVVCMVSVHHLTQCLLSLRAQRDAPAFDVTVVCDPEISGVEPARQQFPEVRFVINAGQSTPLQLVSRALHECTGELILLTKDYCVPGADWVRTMVSAQAPGRSVVGGRVEPALDATATDWAFYYIDYYRYTVPIVEGPVSSLTVCNVSYQRSRLKAIPALWQETFFEASVNDALARIYGSLWMHPESEVKLNRHLTLSNAISERYVFGRLFGCSRIVSSSARQRLFYALFAPALPPLLFGRMAARAVRSRRHATALARSFIPLTLMILGRFWGEWLAYITGRPPRVIRSHATN